jgi:hypothetical protein
LATVLFIAGVFVGDGVRLADGSFRYLVGLTMQAVALAALIINSRE